MVIASLAPVGWTASMSPEGARPEVATAFGESPTAKGIVRPLIETSRVKPLRSILGSQILIPIVPVPDIALAAIVDYPGALVGAANLDSATGSLIPVPPIQRKMAKPPLSRALPKAQPSASAMAEPGTR